MRQGRAFCLGIEDVFLQKRLRLSVVCLRILRPEDGTCGCLARVVQRPIIAIIIDASRPCWAAILRQMSDHTCIIAAEINLIPVENRRHDQTVRGHLRAARMGDVIAGRLIQIAVQRCRRKGRCAQIRAAD